MCESLIVSYFWALWQPREVIVIVSDLGSLKNGVLSGTLKPGIFHTKSLTPGSSKIDFHQILIDKGFSITSIDEEGGLVDHGYDEFAKLRYSEETIKQVSAVFGWGSEDTEVKDQTIICLRS